MIDVNAELENIAPMPIAAAFAALAVLLVRVAEERDSAHADGVRDGLQQAADHLRHFGTGSFDRDVMRAEQIERLIPLVK